MILEEWPSGYGGGLLILWLSQDAARVRISPPPITCDEMASNSGEGLVVPYGNSKSLLDGKGQRHKTRLDVGYTLTADSFTGFYRYIASRHYG